MHNFETMRRTETRIKIDYTYKVTSNQLQKKFIILSDSQE